jgi:hypothetical protein
MCRTPNTLSSHRRARHFRVIVRRVLALPFSGERAASRRSRSAPLQFSSGGRSSRRSRTQYNRVSSRGLSGLELVPAIAPKKQATTFTGNARMAFLAGRDESQQCERARIHNGAPAPSGCRARKKGTERSDFCGDSASRRAHPATPRHKCLGTISPGFSRLRSQLVENFGGADGDRTRDLLRDRQAF